MSGSASPPRGSAYNPPQCDHETLMCLVGAVPEPSRSLSRPSFVLAGAHRGIMLDPPPLNLSERFMSLAEWRDRVLTRNEQRVARPVEIAAAMRRGKLHEMRHLWTQRIAQAGLASRGSGCAGVWTVEGEEADKEDDTLLERAIDLQITRAMEETGRQFGETMAQVQREEDRSDPFINDTAAVMPLETAETVAKEGSAVDNMIRQVEAAIKDFEAVIGRGADAVVAEARKTPAPPRIPLDNPVPENAEQYHKCDRSKQTMAAKCIYCDDDAVIDGVYKNLI